MCDFLPERGDEVVVPPQAVRIREEVPETVIVTPISDFMRLLPKVVECPFTACSSMLELEGTWVLHSHIGAPAVVLMLEPLIAAGVRRVIFLGMAGSLRPEAPIGTLVLPEWAVREEGTSYHYLPAGVIPRASEELLNGLHGELRRLGEEPLRGGVWTTDAPFVETRGKIRRYAEMGVLAVEMECSALMALSEVRGFDFAAGLVITDELFGERWRAEFRGEKVREGERKLMMAALSLAERLRGRSRAGKPHT